VEKAQASVGAVQAGDSASMLYDSIKCVGCRACQVACKARSNLPPVLDSSKLYEAPRDLSAYTWTLIQLYKSETATSFVKHQCMHCIDPACVSVCPVAALEKTASGPVVYHQERCIGCRYCMAACPFGIPKSQWDKALPLIQKCDFCADRLADGQQPACGAVCPTGALISGTRQQMLETAYSRLTASRAYYQHVYGENEAGGTSMLYIANTNFKNLGFPELSDRDLPPITWPYMKAVPAVIAVMVTLCTGIYLRTHRGDSGASKKEA
jgi:formate dehydrogenase iron-sulfur subunit